MATSDSLDLSASERRACILLIGRLQRDLLGLSTTELGNGSEALALDFAYSRVDEIMSDQLDSVIANDGKA